MFIKVLLKIIIYFFKKVVPITIILLQLIILRLVNHVSTIVKLVNLQSK